MKKRTPLKHVVNELQVSKDIHIPRYNRSDVKTGIVHIGVGGFHRAHQAYLIDRLLEQGATGWGICGVALLESDRKIYDVLSEQDGLYTLMIPDTKGSFSVRIIGSIIEMLYAPEDPGAVIFKMADESIRLITLTITEGGYNLNSDGNFNWNNENVLWDLQYPDRPKTIFGYILAALKHRRAKDVGGLTIQSCDNMEHNGDVMRRMLYAFTEKADPGMTEWLDTHVTFPNSMVDRITPVTTPTLSTILAEEFGLIDGWPVICEPFYQWIIQDTYSTGRPEWEQVGAQLVTDVTPYEKMKVRLLNGGHTLTGLAGYLSGYRYIHESVTDPMIADLLRGYMNEEVTSTLDEVPGIDLHAYKNMLIERFGNPFIKDEVSRILSGSSAKFPKFILPVILDRLIQKQSVHIAAWITAGWYHYLNLNRLTPHHIQDEMATALLESVTKAEQEQNPLLFLNHSEIFRNIKEYSTFTDSFLSHIKTLSHSGLKQSIECVLNGGDLNNEFNICLPYNPKQL